MITFLSTTFADSSPGRGFFTFGNTPVELWPIGAAGSMCGRSRNKAQHASCGWFANVATPHLRTMLIRVGEPEKAVVGVGAWPGGKENWPSDAHYDPELLTYGDTRNVVDRYRYWRHEAIVADLDARRHPFHIAIENWQHDLNIGSIVRTANGFLAEAVHIVGRRRWNRRGAMVTDRYQHIVHHASIDELVTWTAENELPIIAADNTPGAVPVDAFPLPKRCMLLFGQEGPGLSDVALAAATAHVEIRQYGSTRSLNAAAAAAIIMHEWVRRHAIR